MGLYDEALAKALKIGDSNDLNDLHKSHIKGHYREDTRTGKVEFVKEREDSRQRREKFTETFNQLSKEAVALSKKANKDNSFESHKAAAKAHQSAGTAAADINDREAREQHRQADSFHSKEAARLKKLAAGNSKAKAESKLAASNPGGITEISAKDIDDLVKKYNFTGQVTGRYSKYYAIYKDGKPAVIAGGSGPANISEIESIQNGYGRKMIHALSKKTGKPLTIREATSGAIPFYYKMGFSWHSSSLSPGDFGTHQINMRQLKNPPKDPLEQINKDIAKVRKEYEKSDGRWKNMLRANLETLEFAKKNWGDNSRR